MCVGGWEAAHQLQESLLNFALLLIIMIKLEVDQVLETAPRLSQSENLYALPHGLEPDGLLEHTPALHQH